MSVQKWTTPLQGLDSLRQIEDTMPSPGPGEVLVKINAVSLNYRDVEGENPSKQDELRLISVSDKG